MILAFMSLATCHQVHAQSQSKEHPSLSKQVNHLHVDKSFFQQATIHTGEIPLAKEVHKTKVSTAVTNRVRLSGTPEHVISKAIAKFQQTL